jgi:hypothetical protein
MCVGCSHTHEYCQSGFVTQTVVLEKLSWIVIRCQFCSRDFNLGTIQLHVYKCPEQAYTCLCTSRIKRKQVLKHVGDGSCMSNPLPPNTCLAQAKFYNMLAFNKHQHANVNTEHGRVTVTTQATTHGRLVFAVCHYTHRGLVQSQELEFKSFEHVSKSFDVDAGTVLRFQSQVLDAPYL